MTTTVDEWAAHEYHRGRRNTPARRHARAAAVAVGVWLLIRLYRKKKR